MLAIQNNFRLIITPLAAEITIMSSGEEFLEYALSDCGAEEYMYDIVVLDNHMGGIEGIDALKQAHEQGWWGIVIMCSASEDPELQLRFEEEANLVLCKNGVGRNDFRAAFKELGW